MVKIAVIANQRQFASYMKENLDTYFSGVAVINCYDTKEIQMLEMLEEKHIVISAFTIFQQVKKKTAPDATLIIADLTLNKDGAEALRKLPPGTRALLVNIDYRSCMEVITMIYSAGYKELELIPFYPGCGYDKSIKVAVTPDEINLVPKEINTAVDIGQRVIDVNCILELADLLQIENPFASDQAAAAKRNILSTNSSLEKVFGENESLTEQMEALIQLVNQGILVTDVKGKIHLCNYQAANILKGRTDLIRGFSITEILPEVEDLRRDLRDGDRPGELIEIGGTAYIASVKRILSKGEMKGSIVTLDNFNEAESRQHKMRKKLMGYSHQAVYTFDDILGESTAIHEVKKIAMRMARSESSVTLYGESGTGKELFAQSMHNHSARRNHNFVAVNCSALPENLLESELYGYEEGAFSGARKGGKSGLFELAHQGTIFLDEIGELPLSLQAKLLRVIEEKKILRVGGMELIDVDVRIITATNRDLMGMVKEKTFRKDLYYRLNVLPIHIPALRDRKEDIPLLFNQFVKALDGKVRLTDTVLERLERHGWEGNIRELKNTVEYLVNLGEEYPQSADIPLADFENNETAFAFTAGESLVMEEFFAQERHNLDLYRFLLYHLSLCYERKERIGRNQLTKLAAEQNLFITEQEIKNGLAKMNAFGFVRSERGRKGSVITPLGQKLNQRIGR